MVIGSKWYELNKYFGINQAEKNIPDRKTLSMNSNRGNRNSNFYRSLIP